MVVLKFCTLSLLPEKEIMEISQASAQIFGRGYFESLVNGKHDKFTVARMALFSGQLVGYLIASIIDEEEGLVKIFSIVVLPQYRGHNLSEELLDAFFKYYLRVEGVTGFTIDIWKSGPDEISATKLFQQVGFKPVGEPSELWFKSSIENRFDCVNCGNPPCQCLGQVYYLGREEMINTVKAFLKE